MAISKYVITGCLLALVGNAYGQLVHNITIGSPKALALGNAVTADPPGIDSIHFNPAGLAKISGRQYQLKLLAAGLNLQEEFGERRLDLVETLPGAPPIAEAYENISGQPYPDDPVENTSASTSTPMLALPGAGLTEVGELIVPLGGIAVEDPENQFVYATSVYAPQALGYQRDENSSSRFQGQEFGLARITYFAPSIGFKVSDELSLGASVNFSWQGLGLKTQIRAPEFSFAFLENFTSNLEELGLPDGVVASIAPYDHIAELSLELEDALSIGFNLGLLWEPAPWFAIGVVYQSEATSELSGDYKMTYSSEWLSMTQSQILRLASPVLGVVNGGYPLNSERVESGTAKAELITPQHIAIGTSIRVVPDLKVNVDVKWIDYAEWQSLDVSFENSIDFLTLSDLVYRLDGTPQDERFAEPANVSFPQRYKSVLSWAIGFEYDYNDYLKLRWGYEPRKGIIPKETASPLAPLSDADLYTFGFEYSLDLLSKLQLGFGYLTATADLPAGTSDGSNSLDAGRIIYNPYNYLDIQTELSAYILALSYDSKF